MALFCTDRHHFWAGVLAYGATEAEVRAKTTALALRVIADRIEHGEPVPFDPSDLFVAA